MAGTATTEGILSFEPDVVRLESISPTRFASMRNCALREVWAANRAPALLPSSPAARLGTVIHRLLEEAGQATFRQGDSDAIDRRWEELVELAEQAMQSTWLERHIVPLRTSVSDFEVRHIQARERALELAETASHGQKPQAQVANSELPHGCEIPVSTRDGRIRGRIDAIVLSGNEAVIRDYKSGAIFEASAKHAPILKEAYETQLRMYAALYAQTCGRWPARLEVVPIFGPPQPVDLDEATCTALIDRARAALDDVNRAISMSGSGRELQQQLATPGAETCSHCTYRPACSSYQAISERQPPWPNDLWGRLDAITHLADGRLLMAIWCGEQVIRVRGLTAGGRHPALHLLEPDDPVAIFNLRATGSPTMFTESLFTVIYKMPPGSHIGALAT
jgi:RecB family exonuclease